MRHLGLLLAAAAGGLLLSACSQIDSLTPVGGAAVTSVRNATNDVLVDQQVSILVAPVCTEVDSGFTCTGSTTDGREILTKAGATSPYELTISIDGEVIYTGTAKEVLEAAVLESS
jgi:hypothetical protein